MNAQVTTLTTTEPRRSVLVTMATKYSMEPQAFEATLRATVVPNNTTREQFAAFLVVANEYGLNPLTKEIYAFPAKSGGIVPIVSIDGWCNLINSHPQCDGVEFDDHVVGDKVTAITARLWRKDRSKPIVVTEYLAECQRNTDTWKQYPRRMLRHKALIQCARYAFGFAGIVDPDEAERMGADVSQMRDVSTPRSDGPPMPSAMKIEQRHTVPMARAEASSAGDLELVEAGRHDGRQEMWGDPVEASAPLAPSDDNDGLGPFDRRAAKAKAEDEKGWLNELSGAFSGCEDFGTLGEQQKAMMMPKKKEVSSEAWSAAESIFRQNFERLQAATD